jgi:hypothetical protein
VGYGWATMKGPFIFLLCGAVDIGISKTYARTWYNEENKPDFQLTYSGKNPNIGTSVSPELLIQFSKRMHLDIKPYLTLWFSDYYFGPLTAQLGIPNTKAYYDANYKSSPTRFGIDIKLMWGGVVEK